MQLAEVLVAAWVVLFCSGGWMTHALLMLRTTRVMPLMAKLVATEPEQWPRVSIIIPACNEGLTLEAAVKSLLAEDYPNLEIILVNDRSTDETGKIVDRIGAADARVLPIHITHLPPGWLGKVHALHTGMQQARGEWVLLTDADVHFRQGTLRKVVAWAQAQDKDFVTALPEVYSPGFWLEVSVLALGELMGVASKLWTIGQPGSNAYAGVGPFNLLRRSVFDRSEGFEWLRMEVSEDVGVGLLMQRAGARMAIVNARGQLKWEWYPTVGAMMRGLEKNTFALLGQFSYWRAALLVVLLGLTTFAPLAAFLLSDALWLRMVATAALALHGVYGVVFARWLGCNPLAGLSIPLGKLLVAWALARSTWLCWRRGGVIWRGTTYPLSELEAGRRVKP